MLLPGLLTLAEIHIIECRICLNSARTKKAEEYLNAAHWSFLKSNDKALVEKKKERGQALSPESFCLNAENKSITKSIFTEHSPNYTSSKMTTAKQSTSSRAQYLSPYPDLPRSYEMGP